MKMVYNNLDKVYNNFAQHDRLVAFIFIFCFLLNSSKLIV